MTELRTNLNLKLKTKTMNIDLGFNKGTTLLNVILDSLRFTSMDMVRAKKEINEVIDKKIQDKIDRDKAG